MEEFSALRLTLHEHPEVSGKEEHTAKIIKSVLEQYHPDDIIEGIAGFGIIAVFKGNGEGPTVAIRAELDALPIIESNDFSHKSKYNGVSHKCGHDGHMAIVSSLAAHYSSHRPNTGKLVLLFQPAEEIGEGAKNMLQDSRLHLHAPDYIFALHNLPRVPFGKVICKSGVFNVGSLGITLTLTGKTSHAAEPENGISPALAMAEIIKLWSGLNQNQAFITVVHSQLGEEAFGIAPGTAKIMATLRAYTSADLTQLEKLALAKAQAICKEYSLKCEVNKSDCFDVSENDTNCFQLIKQAADANDIPFEEMEEPLKWSEDFGMFTSKFKGAMFGLGAGTDTPDLHNPDYDFPDSLIPIGHNMFKTIIDQILSK